MMIIEKHLRFLVQRGDTHTSIRHRKDNIVRLASRLPVPLDEVKPEHLVAWRDGLRVSVSSVHTYVSHVRAFFRWAHDEGYMDTDPALRLRGPRVKPRHPRPIPEEDLRLALRLSEGQPRLRAYLVLAAFCGLRAAEIAAVMRTDIQEDGDGGGFLTVHGKGEKDRVVRLPPEVLAELAPFRHIRAEIFRRPSGKPVTPNQVTREVSAHLHGLGIDYTCHTLRHRFATRLTDLGADVRDTQHALGHASLATTTIYVSHNARRSARSVDKLGKGLATMTKRQSRQGVKA